MKQKIKEMQADPQFQLLIDIDKVLNSARVWGGTEWTYQPIHPLIYRKVAGKVRTAIDKLKADYGVEE